MRIPNPRILPLVVALAVDIPLAAQEPDALDPAMPGDTLPAQAVSVARIEAGQRSVDGYFFGSFLGGAATGFLVPVAAGGEPVVVIGALAGVWLMVANGRNARSDPALPPSAMDERVESRPTAYQEAFRAAYREELVRRRTRAGRYGAATGIVSGLVGLVWLVLASVQDF